ncbi:MAG: choice-of-anchor R domain-containing protein [Candidatus Sungbacteria bacterium]|nr:choice-of-anchor R domain-containing protein [Candidatus Sungbacteria bacterium]
MSLFLFPQFKKDRVISRAFPRGHPEKLLVSGFGLVEIIVALAIITGVLVGFIQSEIAVIGYLRNQKTRLEASLLNQESIEAVRLVRDGSWVQYIAPLVDDVPYYPAVQNGIWVLSASSPGLISNKYTRHVIFNAVNRDAQDRIAVAGTLDAGTRRVTAVSYELGRETAVATYEEGTTDAAFMNFPANNNGDGDVAQSFTTPVGSAVTVSSIDLFVRRVAGTNPSPIFLEVRSGSTVGAVAGTSELLDTHSIPEDQLTWTKFTFITMPTLNANTKYYMRLRSQPDSTVALSGSKPLVRWGFVQNAALPYGDGEAWLGVGKSNNALDQGVQQNAYDFSFRVKRETNAGRRQEIVTYLTKFPDLLTGGVTELLAVSYELGTTDTDLGNFPSNNSGDGDPAQSFTTSAAIAVSKVELSLRRAASVPSDVFLELRAGSTIGPVRGISQIIKATTINGDNLTWVPFRFAPAVPLDASTKYFIRMRSVPTSIDVGSGSQGTVTWGYVQNAGTPYNGGEVWRSIGKLSNPSDSGQELNTYDFSFRVYSIQ